MHELSLNIRKMFKQGDDIRDAGLTTPEDIVRFDDIVYGDDPVWQSLDVYRPKAAEGKLPVIVDVHGGGWVYGDKQRYQHYCMALAQRGFAVVNFSYRLAPESLFPAQVEDTNSVFHWVLSNADKYGFDLNNVFGVGDSAGAHILGLYTAICTNPTCAAKFDFSPPDGFVPKAISLNCGTYSMERGLRQHDELLMAEFMPGGGSDEDRDMLNVLANITESFPPVYFMTCTGDFLQPEALSLAAVLQEKKIPHVYRYYGDAQTELGHVFQLNIRTPEAIRCNDDTCEFFRRLCC